MKKTFAQRANALKKKYKRADYDKEEKEELVEELRKLRAEQEAFRADNGFGEEEEEESEGQEETEVDEYDGTGKSYLYPQFSSGLPGAQYNQAMLDRLAPNKFQAAAAPKWNTTIKAGQPFSAVPNTGATPMFDSLKSSGLSSAISTGVSLLGNIIGASEANKRAKEPGAKLPRMAAEQISLEPEREALRRSYGTATNVALANSRNMSSPANAYANQVAGISTLTDSLGTGMSQSYMNEANTNAQMRQQAGEANAMIGSREAMYNSQRRDALLGQGDAYRDAAFQAIPQGLQDYRAQRSQDQWMSTMGKDYGLYQQTMSPNATFWQKLMEQLYGPDYSIQSREYANSLRK